MKIGYAQKCWFTSDVVRSTIFLAGPTPRDPCVSSWRPEAFKILERLRFQGIVIVPEDEGGGMSGDKEKQKEWELHALTISKVIAFWIPRDIVGGMPGFTTNVEFGMFLHSGKCLLGYPPSANKMSYLRFHADRVGMFVTRDLEALMAKAVSCAQ